MFEQQAAAYNAAIMLMKRLSDKRELTAARYDELMGIAMGILRDSVKHDADPASVEQMIEEVTGDIRERLTIN